MSNCLLSSLMNFSVEKWEIVPGNRCNADNLCVGEQRTEQRTALKREKLRWNRTQVTGSKKYGAKATENKHGRMMILHFCLWANRICEILPVWKPGLYLKQVSKSTTSESFSVTIRLRLVSLSPSGQCLWSIQRPKCFPLKQPLQQSYRIITNLITAANHIMISQEVELWRGVARELGGKGGGSL